nr:ABC transporter permease [uncultured Rhodopila sp.]
MIWLRVVLPLSAITVLLLVWQKGVAYYGLSSAILPAPTLIAQSLIDDWALLSSALLHTAIATYEAFALAALIAIILSVLFVRSRLIEAILSPFVVALQVTPVVAIAPLILIWVGLDNVARALLILATIIAFFPMLSNTILGLKSADHNLRDLMLLSRANSWQRLIYLEFPSAMPFILAGMKTSIGLALIGSVVAEFVAGSGTATGLAWVILEAANRLESARMFAALVLLSVFGLLNFLAISAVQYLLLRRWHDSATSRER